MNNLSKHVKAIISEAFPCCVLILSIQCLFPCAECGYKTLSLDLWLARGSDHPLWRTMCIYTVNDLNYMKTQSIKHTQNY